MSVEIEIQNLSRALTQSIGNLAKELSAANEDIIQSLSSSGPSATNKPSNRTKNSKSLLELDEKLRNSTNSLVAWSKTLNDVNAAAKKLRAAENESIRNEELINKLKEDYIHLQESLNDKMNRSDIISSRNIEIERLKGKSLGEQIIAIRRSARSTSALATAAAKTARASSLLGASLIESSENFQYGSQEYYSYIDNLSATAGKLNTSILKGANLIDSATGTLHDNLNTGDFANLRSTIGAMTETMNESFSGFQDLGVNSLQEAIAKQTELIQKVKTVKDSNGNPVQPGGDDLQLQNRLGDLSAAFVKSAENLIMQNGYLATDILGLDYSFNAAENQVIKFVKELDSSGQEVTKAVHISAEELGDALKNIKPEILAASLSKLDKNINANAKGFDNLAFKANTLAGKLSSLADEIKKSGGLVSYGFDKLKGNLTSTATIMSGLAMAGEGLKKTWQDVSKFNIAQVPASFMDVTAASWSMGMSFEETTKFMQENKRALAIFGGDTSKLTGGLKDTFAKFGYNMQQAAEIVGPAIEAGISSGINIKSGDALNKFIDQSMDSFKNISGIVNITAKEYMALNADLLNSQDVASQMIGMDQERAQQYAKDTIAARDHYVQMGLSTQMANELLKAQQAQMRGKVQDKVREAAKGMAMAQQLGMDPEEAQRYFQLAIKKRTVDEDKEFAAIAGKMGTMAEQREQQAMDTGGTSGYLAQQVATQALMPSDTAKLQEAGREAEKQKRAGQNIDSDEARKMGEKAQGSKAVAEAGNAINTVSTFLTTGFIAAIGGASLALAGFAGQLMMAGGKGGIGGLIEGVKTIFSSGAGAATTGTAATGVLGSIGSALGYGAAGVTAGSVLAGVAGGGVGAVAGMAGQYAGDKLKENGYEKTGGAVSTLGTAAKYAGIGAMVGSVIPVAGTAIGAGIGGLAGVGKGLYDNWGSMFGSSKENKEATVSTPQKDSSLQKTTEALAPAAMNQPDNKGNTYTFYISGASAKDVDVKFVDGIKVSTNATKQIDQKPDINPFSSMNFGMLGAMLLPAFSPISIATSLLSKSADSLSSFGDMMPSFFKKDTPSSQQSPNLAFDDSFGLKTADLSDKTQAAIIQFNKVLQQNTDSMALPGQTPQVDLAQSMPVRPEQPGSSQQQKDVNKKSGSNTDKSVNTADTTLEVADETAHGKLSDISDNMAIAVKILQLIADNATNPATVRQSVPESKFLNSQQTPTAYSYVTGRA